MLAPRPYQHPADLPALHAILQLGRQAALPAYYVHPGDVNWWLHYLLHGQDLSATCFVWDDPAPGNTPRGWALLSPDFRAFDVFVRPDLYGTDEAAAMWTWTEVALMAQAGPGARRTLWVSADDAWLSAHLTGRGFTRAAEQLVALERTLAEIPEPALPAGFTTRRVAAADLGARAAAAHAAFGSGRPLAEYTARYAAFAQSAAYAGAHDTIVVAPDGRVAAFAIGWPDPLNAVGLLEPVGTHPDFQRRGLGLAAIYAVLRVLCASGLRRALVSTEHTNAPALQLYTRAGFAPVTRLHTYERLGAPA